jgi:hypothetical protein
MQPNDDQNQRKNIAQVMASVAQERKAVLPKAHASFNADKKKIQNDGCPQDFAHLSIIGSHMMMVVMMMFVTHRYLCYFAAKMLPFDKVDNR